MEQRRVELPGTEEIKKYVAEFRAFLEVGMFLARKALIRNFVEGIEVVGDEATLTYTIPMTSDGVTREGAAVLDLVQSGVLFRGQYISRMKQQALPSDSPIHRREGSTRYTVILARVDSKNASWRTGGHVCFRW